MEEAAAEVVHNSKRVRTQKIAPKVAIGRRAGFDSEQTEGDGGVAEVVS